MTVKVRVSADLVAEAIRQSNSRCGISLALREAGFDRPYVDQDVIRFSDPKTGQRFTYETPAKAAKWIDKFDSDVSTRVPIEVVLEEADLIEARPLVRSQPSVLIAQAKRDAARKTHTSNGVRSYRPRRDS
jgi:hypothetical protein